MRHVVANYLGRLVARPLVRILWRLRVVFRSRLNLLRRVLRFDKGLDGRRILVMQSLYLTATNLDICLGRHNVGVATQVYLVEHDTATLRVK